MTRWLAAAVCFSLVTDAYRNPPSLKGSAAYAVGNYLGPYAFFTKHALTIQCSHGVLSFLGELLLDGRLVAMTHAFACFSAVVGIALTVLLTRRIASPIQELVEVTHDIAEGHFERDLKITTDGEIGDLSVCHREFGPRELSRADRGFDPGDAVLSRLLGQGEGA